eukprot:PhM_4_TR8006/c0_g1_i1/m.97600
MNMPFLPLQPLRRQQCLILIGTIISFVTLVSYVAFGTLFLMSAASPSPAIMRVSTLRNGRPSLSSASPSSPATRTCSDYNNNCAVCTAHSSECVFCAPTRECVPKEHSHYHLCVGGDIEEEECSAILLHPFPTSFRVLHVGRQTGGPEALIQLFLALNSWGFDTTLDTRKKQVGGAVKKHFLQSYKQEFNSAPPLRWFGDYKQWVSSATPRDVLISTETWPCVSGAVFDSSTPNLRRRQINYHLTIQHRRNTYDVSKHYIHSADPFACSAIAHTHFMAQEFLNISHNAVLFPYMSPHIMAEASAFLSNEQTRNNDMKNKENLVLIDGDCGLVESDFEAVKRQLFKHNKKVTIVKAAGLKPDKLYELYKRAKVAVDASMPGAERMTLEASLFGDVVVIGDDMNGASEDDFPFIPRELRVRQKSTNKADFISNLNTAVGHALENYDSLSSGAEYVQLREFVRQSRTQFYRSVRQYFSDSVHIVLQSPSPSLYAEMAVSVLSVLLLLPFATVEVRVPNVESYRRFLKDSSALCIFQESYLMSSIAVGEIVGNSKNINNENDVVIEPGQAAYIAKFVVLKESVSMFGLISDVLSAKFVRRCATVIERLRQQQQVERTQNPATNRKKECQPHSFQNHLVYFASETNQTFVEFSKGAHVQPMASNSSSSSSSSFSPCRGVVRHESPLPLPSILERDDTIKFLCKHNAFISIISKLKSTLKTEIVC